MTSFQCSGLALIWFLRTGRKWLVFSVSIEITGFLFKGFEIELILEWWWKWTWVQWCGRNQLGFYVRDRIDLVLALGSNLTCFRAAVKIDFGFVCGPKSTLFWFMDRNWLCFRVRAAKWLVFSVGIDWLSFCAGGQNWLGFCMLVENNWF